MTYDDINEIALAKFVCNRDYAGEQAEKCFENFMFWNSFYEEYWAVIRLGLILAIGAGSVYLIMRCIRYVEKAKG